MEDLKVSGTCVCGNVEVNVTGKPMTASYCHCLDCQRSHSAPMFQAVIFSVTQVTFNFPKGGDLESNILKLKITEKGPERYTCHSCGARVANRRDVSGLPSFCAVPATLLQQDKPLPAEYKPVMHLCYSERTVNVKDGLPKYAKMPAVFGGSDELVAEE